MNKDLSDYEVMEEFFETRHYAGSDKVFKHNSFSLILKEKKDRTIHFTLDPILGPKLVEIYDKMAAHPRVKICSNWVDASELISVSDMVVSFPFTSTISAYFAQRQPRSSMASWRVIRPSAKSFSKQGYKYWSGLPGTSWAAPPSKFMQR